MRRQAIIWTNGGQVHCGLYALLALNYYHTYCSEIGILEMLKHICGIYVSFRGQVIKFKFKCVIFPTVMHDVIYNLYVVRFWSEDGQISMAYWAVNLNTNHKCMNTVNYRYITVEYYMILKTARKWRKRNFTKTKTKNSGKTPHTSIFRASHGVSPLSSLQKIHSEISIKHCILSWKTENHRDANHAFAIGITDRRQRRQVRHHSNCPASGDCHRRKVQSNIQDLFNYWD